MLTCGHIKRNMHFVVYRDGEDQQMDLKVLVKLDRGVSERDSYPPPPPPTNSNFFQK